MSRSHTLVLKVYELTQRLPADERFGLTSQFRRAATSVVTNIAEGSRREHGSDFARFLNLAEDSLAEVEYRLRLCRDLGCIDADSVRRHAAEEPDARVAQVWICGGQGW